MSAYEECWIDCEGKLNSNETVKSEKECFCDSGSKWDSTAEECYKDCTGVQNSGETAASFTSCNCISGMLWDTSL